LPGAAPGIARVYPSHPITFRLNAAVVNALAEPELRSHLVDLAYEIPPREQQTSQALDALQRDKIEKWWPIIKAANVKAE
jgi:hypothetical protein